MSHCEFDAPELRAAMAAYLDVAERLDEVAAMGGEARELLDLAEGKAIAGMALRRRLDEAGFASPVRQRVSQ